MATDRSSPPPVRQEPVRQDPATSKADSSRPGPRPSAQDWAKAAASPRGILALAPMDGVTDATFRELITSLHGPAGPVPSGIDLCVTEFVRVCSQTIPDSVFWRHCPELRHQSRTRAQTPVFVQLLGGEVEAMTRAAIRAYELGAMGIDINFGCPAKTVNRHDGGATLLKAPRRIASVCGAIRKQLPDTVPVTAKIRLGWEDARGVEDLARAAQDGGATWLTIHARTRVQLYRPPVDWRAIDRARQAVSIPVLANGDVFDPASYAACQAQSGCSSVMIGRGIMADPSLFLRIRGQNPPRWELPAMAKLWQEYGQQLILRNPERTHPLGRVKQWVRMAAQIRAEFEPAFDHFKRIQEWNRAQECLHEWANSAADSPAASPPNPLPDLAPNLALKPQEPKPQEPKPRIKANPAGAIPTSIAPLILFILSILTPDLAQSAPSTQASRSQTFDYHQQSQSSQAPGFTQSLNHPLAASLDCATCHAFANRSERSAEPPYAPMAWLGSLMANAARDPVFWAGVALANQDAPGHTEDCIRCHSPRAFLEGRGKITQKEDLHPKDRFGVSCDFCHRMIDPQSKDPSAKPGNAKFLLDDDAIAPLSPPKRGPWHYESIDRLKHGFVQDLHFIGDSHFCGTCHDVTTHRAWLEPQAKGSGSGFPEQRTYSEWKNSDFAQGGPGSPNYKSCQDCHMPAVANVAGAKELESEGIYHEKGARRHLFGGANLHMIGLLKAMYGDQGSNEIPDFYFDDAAAASQAQLKAAARLEVVAPPSVDLRQISASSSGAANTGTERSDETKPGASPKAKLGPIDVRVTNLSGHKLPTGYSEGRVMWLELVLRYKDQIVASSGRFDPNHRSIEQDPQVRRYEALAENAGTGQVFHLLMNNRWRFDTRIPPKGLRPDPQTDPIGGRYTLQDGTWPNFDQVRYHFALPEIQDASPGTSDDDHLQLAVRLLYWINTDDYLNTLIQDNQSNKAGQQLAELLQKHGRPEPMVLAEHTQKIQISAFPAPKAKPPAKDPSKGGCSCRSGAPQTPAFLGWLLLLVSLRLRKQLQAR